MQRSAKWLLGVAILAGLGLAQWKYGIISYGETSAPAQQAAAGGKSRAPSILVKLTQAKKTDFPLIERGFGTMASPQVVAVNARVSSQIIAVKVQDGQMVKAGDVLVTLDDRPLQATLAKDQATLAKDEATLVNANIVLDRAQTLYSRNAGSKQDVDTYTAAQKAAQQTVDADKAVVAADQLQLEYTTVTAPIDGKLGAVAAVPGALVAASTNSVSQSPLMSITQMQPLKVNFRLPEAVLTPLQAALAAGTEATVRVYQSGTHNELDEGKLNFIDSAVDASSGTIGLGANIGNGKLNLWPGQRVDVELEYGKVIGALTVPTVAVQQGQVGSFVWVVDDQKKATVTPVKISRYEGDFAAIAEGLSEGAQVVIEGQAKLANGSEVRIAADTAGSGQTPKPEAHTTSGGAQAATPADMPKKADASTGATQQ